MQIQPSLAAGKPQVAQLATPDRFRPLEVRPGKIVQATIERTFAWTARCRRLARDHEATPSSAIAFFVLAAATVLLRRLAKAI